MKKLPEPNVYVYGKDDTQIMVYNMRRSQKRGDRKKHQRKKTKELVTEKRNSWLLIKYLRPSYSGYAEDNLCILYSQHLFQTTHDRYLFSKIRLVLSPTLYKFIVWACWAKTQSSLGSKPKLVLTVLKAYINHSFLEIFYGKLKKLSKKLVTFSFFIKSFLKWFTNIYPKGTHLYNPYNYI